MAFTCALQSKAAHCVLSRQSTCHWSLPEGQLKCCTLLHLNSRELFIALQCFIWTFHYSSEFQASVHEHYMALWYSMYYTLNCSPVLLHMSPCDMCVGCWFSCDMCVGWLSHLAHVTSCELKGSSQTSSRRNSKLISILKMLLFVRRHIWFSQITTKIFLNVF